MILGGQTSERTSQHKGGNGTKRKHKARMAVLSNHLTNLITMSEVELLVAHAIGQPVMCSTAINANLFPAFDGLNCPAKSIENLSMSPVTGALRFVW